MNSGLTCASKAGPAGLLLATLLTRNGLSNASSLLCIEPRLNVTSAGHADGLHARSLEMFKLLGLYEELMKVSTEVGERARWAEDPAPLDMGPVINSVPAVDIPRLTRVMREKVALAPDARMKQLISIPQGQIEKILEAELMKHATDVLLRGFRVVDARIDETCESHPVLVTVRPDSGEGIDSKTRKIRCKYLIGADGAHSTIRRSLGLTMEGDSIDHVWGVVDFVTDTDFPDIRRLTTVQSNAGMAMIIPREKNFQGEWLTRFYVDMNDLELERKDSIVNSGVQDTATILIKNQQKRSSITTDDILCRLEEIFSPFRMTMKEGTVIEWSTAYAIGQRIASRFTLEDAHGIPRVFLVGDG